MSDHFLATWRRELLEQRDEHRRLLRHVPTRLFNESRWWSPPTAPDSPDEVERYVRAVADDALTHDARVYLEERANADASSWARKALASIDRGNLERAAGGRATELVTSEAPESDREGTTPHDESLLTFTALALVADLAAGDGHADTRIRSR